MLRIILSLVEEGSWGSQKSHGGGMLNEYDLMGNASQTLNMLRQTRDPQSAPGLPGSLQKGSIMQTEL